MNTKILLILLAIFTSLSTFAVVKTYVGPSPGAWETASNWQVAGVPATGDIVIIPAGKTVTVSTNISGTTILNLIVNGVLDLTDNGKLQVALSGAGGAIVTTVGNIIGNSNNDQLRAPDGTTYNNTGINTIGNIGTPNTSYPVKLQSFYYSNLENILTLHWKTSEEIGFQKFELQNSKDAKNFEKLDEIQPNESKTYSFILRNLNIGINYLRLKIIDVDGSFSFSKILAVNTESNAQNYIYPNPVINNMFTIEGTYADNQVMLLSKEGRKMSYTLLNENGRTIVQLLPGQAGLLYLKANGNNSAFSQKIFVK